MTIFLPIAPLLCEGYGFMRYLWKVPKAFSLEPRGVSTQEAVGATHQVTLTMLVKEVWCYNLSFPRSQTLQTLTHRICLLLYVIDTTKFLRSVNPRIFVDWPGTMKIRQREFFLYSQGIFRNFHKGEGKIGYQNIWGEGATIL